MKGSDTVHISRFSRQLMQNPHRTVIVMGFLDQLKNQAERSVRSAVTGKASGSVGSSISNAVSGAVSSLGLKNDSISFSSIPGSLEEFQALPEAEMKTPFDTAALTVLALTVYPTDKALSVAMLNYLRGPRPLNGMELSFIADRFRDKDYVPRSYFEGAVPQNEYTPSMPYTVKVSENPYSNSQQNMSKLFIASGCADSPRSVELRLAKDGKWYLWEQYLLSDIRKPESANPWA